VSEHTVDIYEIRHRNNWKGADTVYDAYCLFIKAPREWFDITTFEKRHPDWRERVDERERQADCDSDNNDDDDDDDDDDDICRIPINPSKKRRLDIFMSEEENEYGEVEEEEDGEIQDGDEEDGGQYEEGDGEDGMNEYGEEDDGEEDDGRRRQRRRRRRRK